VIDSEPTNITRSIVTCLSLPGLVCFQRIHKQVSFGISGTSLWNHDMCLYMKLVWLISMEFMLARTCT
jgi:hypothetical protein